MDAEANRVLKEISPLAAVLYSALEEAIQQALDFFARKKEAVDGWCFSSLVRYHLKMALNKRGYDAIDEEGSSDQDEGISLGRSRLAIWQLDGSSVNTYYLSNNGLCIEYKGYLLRVWKRNGRNLSRPSANPFVADGELWLEMDGIEQWIDRAPSQLLIITQRPWPEGAPVNEGDRATALQKLLVVWDVDVRYQLLGLELILPQSGGQGPVLPKWSIPIPHPIELIEGDSVDEDYMYDPDLPIFAGVRGKKVK